MNACSAAHGKSTEAPVSLPEASAARVPVTTVVAGERFVLLSIVYTDRKLLVIKLNFSATSSNICAHATVHVHRLLLRSIAHLPLHCQEHSDDRWML